MRKTLTILSLAALWNTCPAAVLENDSLSVAIDPDFPRILAYRLMPGGATVTGQAAPVSTVQLNGKDARCSVRFAQSAADSAEYKLTFARQNIGVAMRVRLGDGVVEFAMTDVVERGTTRLMSLSFPGNALLTMPSTTDGAAIAAVYATGVEPPRCQDIRERMGAIADQKPGADSANYFFLSGGGVAAGIASNHIHDIKRVAYTISGEDGTTTCTAQNPEWRYRQIESEILPLPWVKVFVTGDRNDDNEATWQDAALVYRATMPKPFGSEHVRLEVGDQVAMNFASGAQQPFLRILDNIKKIHLATDGIGNAVLIKGFSAEGHDSANTDYGGHYNERAGGLRDLTVLLEKAKDYHARVGIHINASEVYPEAHRYHPDILLRDANGNPVGGWVWLDHAHMIDKTKDTLSGRLFESLDRMRKELPALDFVYVDTYWTSAWPAWKIATKINSLGLTLYTEGNYSLDPWTTWSHWRGHNHQLTRFLWNSDRDLFSNDVLLRGAGHTGFMGWQNEKDFAGYIRSTFARNLPTKYLQSFELLRWDPGREAVFSGGVTATAADGRTTVTRNGRVVMTWKGNGTGNRLFVPWDPVSESKIYLWDDTGQEASWELPPSWNDLQRVYLYRLTDRGRVDETRIPVDAGKVTITPAKGTPYVIYQDKAPAQQPLPWSEGSPVADSGFESHAFGDWTRHGEHVGIENDNIGNARLLISGAGGAAGGVSQEIGGLEPGATYSAWVWVQVTGRRSASIELLPLGVEGAAPVSHAVDRTSVRHSAPNDIRTGTRYQRLKVLFDVPAGCTRARLSLQAAEGSPTSTVEFDDVRIVETRRPAKAAGHWFYEDFENVDMGYGPFTCCPGERTHLSETNKPYTSDTINGRFSLKSRDQGRVLRTLPGTIRFQPWTRYRLVCETLVDPAGKARFTVESGGAIVLDHPFPAGRGRVDVEFATRDDPGSFLSIFRDAGDMLVIDDLAIDELGPVPEDQRVELKLDDDPLPGHRVLVDELFDKPLTADWQVVKSGRPGTGVAPLDDSLVISAAAHVSACIERKLPKSVSAVECHLDIGTDRGETWGPGVSLLWPDGKSMRLNIRSANHRYAVDATPGGQQVLGPCGPLVALRIRLEKDAVIAESREPGAAAWTTLKSFPRTAFPGAPDRVRFGKTHADSATDDHSDPGPEGECRFTRCRIYGRPA